MSKSSFNRRKFLQTGAAGALASAVAGCQTASTGAPIKAAATALRRENEREGARDWQLTRVRLDKNGGYRAPAVEGYCSRQSVLAGESLDIMVSTNPPSQFTIEIFRTGYYGGRGARHMTTLGPFAGKKQPDPEIGDKRLRECKWEPSTSLKIPADWPTELRIANCIHASAPSRAASVFSVCVAASPLKAPSVKAAW